MSVVVSGRTSSSAAEPLNPVRYRMLGRWVTSSASSLSPSSATRRAAWRSARRSGGTQTAHQRLQGQQVALRAESGDHAEREVGDHRVATLRLAGEDVREVQLDEGNLH